MLRDHSSTVLVMDRPTKEPSTKTNPFLPGMYMVDQSPVPSGTGWPSSSRSRQSGLHLFHHSVHRSR